ncbi:PASTA domain-containing protein [bacterium SCSIO 12741]|nr:PASTA domain-containing protein [bacterium SCSIO 12741]
MLRFIRFVFTRQFWINLAIFAVVVVLSIWATMALLKSYTLHGEEIEVPNLRGYHLSEVESILKERQLDYMVVDSIALEDTPGGMIMEQIPDSGFHVKQDRKIYVYVSTYASRKIPVPTLVNVVKRSAIFQLQTLGFKIGEIRYIPAVCVDCVEWLELDSVRVKPGEMLPSGTKLDLVLGGGQGDDFIPVPNLIGMHAFAAEEYLAEQGLRLSAAVPDGEYDPADSLDWFIYRQLPETGPEAVVYLGTTVKVFITNDRNKIAVSSIDSVLTPLDTNEVP